MAVIFDEQAAIAWIVLEAIKNASIKLAFSYLTKVY